MFYKKKLSRYHKVIVDASFDWKHWSLFSSTIILTLQLTVSGHLGEDGPPALSPVDVELNIEVGELSDMLDMVAGDVMEVVGLDDPVTKEDIVKV